MLEWGYAADWHISLCHTRSICLCLAKVAVAGVCQLQPPPTSPDDWRTSAGDLSTAITCARLHLRIQQNYRSRHQPQTAAPAIRKGRGDGGMPCPAQSLLPMVMSVCEARRWAFAPLEHTKKMGHVTAAMLPRVLFACCAAGVERCYEVHSCVSVTCTPLVLYELTAQQAVVPSS